MTTLDTLDITIKLISSIGLVAIVATAVWIVKRVFQLGVVIQRLDA